MHMLGKLSEIFKKKAVVHAPVIHSAAAHKDDVDETHEEDISTTEESKQSNSWPEVDQSFTCLLLGIKSLCDGPMSQSEKASLELIRKNYLTGAVRENMVPRLPSVIPKIMLALRSKDTDVARLAETLSGDMVLISEIIRLANSSYYSRSNVIDSLQQALVNIGFNGIKQVIVSASLKPILNTGSGRFVSSSSRYLWNKSMDAAMLSDTVASLYAQNRFHAFLAALIAQSGMTVVMKDLDKTLEHQAGTPHSRKFVETLNRYTQEISLRISKQWEMPGPVIDTLQELIGCEDQSTLSPLGLITFMSDKHAQVQILKLNGLLNEFNEEAMFAANGRLYTHYQSCMKKMAIGQ